MAQAHSRGGVTGGIQAKLPRQVARIAIVLHCLGNGGLQETEISVDTFHAATKIGDYHLSHAHRALHKHEVKAKYFGEPTLQVKVFDVLEMHWPAWTSTTEMHADLGNNVTRAELNAVLQDAVEAGLVENQKVSTGGRHRQEYRLNANASPEENEESRRFRSSVGRREKIGCAESSMMARGICRYRRADVRSGPQQRLE